MLCDLDKAVDEESCELGRELQPGSAPLKLTTSGPFKRAAKANEENSPWLRSAFDEKKASLDINVVKDSWCLAIFSLLG